MKYVNFILKIITNTENEVWSRSFVKSFDTYKQIVDECGMKFNRSLAIENSFDEPLRLTFEKREEIDESF